MATVRTQGRKSMLASGNQDFDVFLREKKIPSTDPSVPLLKEVWTAALVSATVSFENLNRPTIRSSRI